MRGHARAVTTRRITQSRMFGSQALPRHTGQGTTAACHSRQDAARREMRHGEANARHESVSRAVLGVQFGRLPDELRLSSLNYGFQLVSNSVYKHSAWALVEILRTGVESLPFASLR